jgi:hypothetical protein
VTGDEFAFQVTHGYSKTVETTMSIANACVISLYWRNRTSDVNPQCEIPNNPDLSAIPIKLSEIDLSSLREEICCRPSDHFALECTVSEKLIRKGIRSTLGHSFGIITMQTTMIIIINEGGI